MNFRIFRIVALNKSTGIENTKKSIVVPCSAFSMFFNTTTLKKTLLLLMSNGWFHSDVSAGPEVGHTGTETRDILATVLSSAVSWT